MRALDVVVLALAAVLLPQPALAGFGGWFVKSEIGLVIIMLAVIIYMLARRGRS